MSAIKGAEFKVRRYKRKSYDVDTGDIAGVRKHPWSGPGNVLILPPTQPRSYLLCTRAPPGTKGALPQTASQVFGHFYYTVSGINFEQQKEPPLVCHLWDKAKPRQMNSSGMWLFKMWLRGGKDGDLFFHTSSWHNSEDTTNVPFSGDRDTGASCGSCDSRRRGGTECMRNPHF